MATRATKAELVEFGSLVSAIRINSGMTARELSDRMGVSQSMISRIENGSREPRLDIVRKLCASLPGLSDRIICYLQTGVFKEK